MLPSPYKYKRQRLAFHTGPASASKRISWPFLGQCNAATQAKRNSPSLPMAGQAGIAFKETLTGFQRISALSSPLHICFAASRQLACETKKQRSADARAMRYRSAIVSSNQSPSQLD